MTTVNGYIIIYDVKKDRDSQSYTDVHSFHQNYNVAIAELRRISKVVRSSDTYDRIIEIRENFQNGRLFYYTPKEKTEYYIVEAKLSYEKE